MVEIAPTRPRSRVYRAHRSLWVRSCNEEKIHESHEMPTSVTSLSVGTELEDLRVYV